MDTSFWIKVGLSFLVGGTWVSLASIASERFGSKVGGFIGGLPSTIVVTLLFVGMTQTPTDAAQSAVIIPLVMGLNAVFMTVFITLSRRGLLPALAGAFLVWFCLAGMLVILNIRSLWITIPGWIVLAVSCFLIIEKKLKVVSQGGRSVRSTVGQIAGRAAASGAVVALSVLLSKAAGPLVGGIIAVFPIVFSSSLVISYRSGGAVFAKAVAKSLMISGMVTVPIYACTVWLLYPRVGIGLGTVLAYLASAVAGLLTFNFVKNKVA